LVAHLQFAHANAQTKNCKRATKANAPRQKHCSKLTDKMTENKEHQAVTKAICNKGFSGNSSIPPRIKFRVGGQDSSPQSLTAHSLNR